MCEWLIAWMLRLYPARFRRQFSHEALQLVRDRLRDERGFVRRLRLWSDLLADLAVSLPREYCHAYFATTTTAERLPADGAPAFALLDAGHPRTSSILLGGVLSLLALACFPALMNQFGYFHPSAAWSSAFERAVEKDPFLRKFQPPPNPQAGTRAQPSAVAKFDADARHRVIAGAIAVLKQQSPDQARARKTAEALLAHERNGDDNAAATPADLAHLLTLQMREAADDHDIEMLYSERPIPERPSGPPVASAAYRELMTQSRCGFEKVEVLPGNIGYVKLNEFPMASVCHDTAASTIHTVNGARAVIFDLRDNHGGFDMGQTLAAYLFDHPEYWYSPITNTSRDSWTRSPVAGSKLADKPVYILTSSLTISAAEQFAYNLKMLKRATIVGETTAGGAHAANFHSVGNNFYLGTVDVHAINPYSNYDWNGTGVEPDVKVRAADALATALKLARARRSR